MRVPICEEKVSRKMKAKRVEAGLTQEAVAQAMGKSRATINAQENHPLDMKLRDYLAYAETYGCMVSDFFAGV